MRFIKDILKNIKEDFKKVIPKGDQTLKSNVSQYLLDKYDEEFLITFALFFLFSLVSVPSLFYTYAKVTGWTAFFVGVGMGIGSLLLFLFSFGILYDGSKFLWLILHHVLPGKERREHNQHSQNQRATQRESLFQMKAESRPKIDWFDLQNFNSENAKEKLLRLFNKDSSSFIRFYLERSRTKKEIDYGFINFSLLIPKRRELSLDTLKTILIAQSASAENQHIVNQSIEFTGLSQEDLESGALIDKAFINYSEDQIKKLFTRRYHMVFLYNIISRLKHQADDLVIPVLDTLEEIDTHLRENTARKMYRKELKKLPLTIGNLKYELITHNNQRILIGKEFDNCLRHSSYDNSDLILVHEGSSSLAVVELCAVGLNQIKGHHNQNLLDHQESKIIEDLKTFLEETK